MRGMSKDGFVKFRGLMSQVRDHLSNQGVKDHASMINDHVNSDEYMEEGRHGGTNLDNGEPVHGEPWKQEQEGSMVEEAGESPAEEAAEEKEGMGDNQGSQYLAKPNRAHGSMMNNDGEMAPQRPDLPAANKHKRMAAIIIALKRKRAAS